MPLALHDRVGLDEEERAVVRARLGRQLENFAWHIERVTVRFDDVNGPRGGVDTVCRVKVVLRALPSIVAEARATDALVALGRAARTAGRTVRRALRRAGRSTPPARRRIARRHNVYVGTAARGVSATHRRAGYGATAARNTKRNTAGMTVALEDSRTTPSRKSTRKSANRAKAATLLERKAQRRPHRPAARATRARVERGPRGAE
jgi:hypothetical protein